MEDLKVANCLTRFNAMILCPAVGIQAANEEKVALVMKSLSNPFFSTMESGAKKYA